MFEKIEWDFEDGFILKSKKPCTVNGQHLFCIFVYLKPANSSRNDLTTDKDDFDKLYEKITELRTGGQLLVLGDLNARTGNLCDLYDSTSLSNNNYSPDFFYIDSFITPDDLISNNLSELRKNKDVKTNDYGQKLVNLCKTSGLVICNGRVNGDLDGNFTYVDKKGNSTIDYALVSRELLCNVDSFSVHAPTVFSDHNPIILSLKNIPLHVYSTQDNSFNHNFKQYKWSNEKGTPILCLI